MKSGGGLGPAAPLCHGRCETDGVGGADGEDGKDGEGGACGGEEEHVKKVIVEGELEFSEAHLGDAMAELEAAGATEILLLPMFLPPGLALCNIVLAALSLFGLFVVSTRCLLTPCCPPPDL